MQSFRRAACVHPQRLVVISMLLVLAGCEAAGPPPGESTSAPAPAVDPVERGRYLVGVSSCNDCHTPWKMGPAGPVPDTTRLLSGHPSDMVMTMPAIPEGWDVVGSASFTAWAGPWGISYAANLTPDPSGIGNISEDMFIQAMRTGNHYGTGRPILPPMPWTNVGSATDEDLKAMFAYLRSIPPIANVVPEPTAPAGPPAG